MMNSETASPYLPMNGRYIVRVVHTTQHDTDTSYYGPLFSADAEAVAERFNQQNGKEAYVEYLNSANAL